MLYKIKNEYYVKVGMKYAKVTFKIENGQVLLEPTSEYLEKTNNMVVTEQLFNDSFKESIMKSYSRNNENEEDSKKTSDLKYRR